MAGKIKVVPSDRKWEVRDAETNKLIRSFHIKESAIRFAKSLSYTQNSKLVIYNSNGIQVASYDRCRIY